MLFYQIVDTNVVYYKELRAYIYILTRPMLVVVIFIIFNIITIQLFYFT